MEGAITAILEWVIASFGVLDAVLIFIAIYLGWLHQQECRDHEETIKYSRQLQNEFYKSSLAQTVVLTELKTALTFKGRR